MSAAALASLLLMDGDICGSVARLPLHQTATSHLIYFGLFSLKGLTLVRRYCSFLLYHGKDQVVAYRWSHANRPPKRKSRFATLLTIYSVCVETGNENIDRKTL